MKSNTQNAKNEAIVEKNGPPKIHFRRIEIQEKLLLLFAKKNKIKINVLCQFLWRIMMNLLTTAQVAKEWGISQRRVDILCKEGRVEGAIMMGNRWFIPNDSLKPEDKRRAKIITDCGGNPHG